MSEEAFVLTKGALKDLERIVREGGVFEVTKSTDGLDIILARTKGGYTRTFRLEPEEC